MASNPTCIILEPNIILTQRILAVWRLQNYKNTQLISTVLTKNTLSYKFWMIVRILLSITLKKQVCNNGLPDVHELHQLLPTPKKVTLQSHVIFFLLMHFFTCGITAKCTWQKQKYIIRYQISMKGINHDKFRQNYNDVYNIKSMKTNFDIFRKQPLHTLKSTFRNMGNSMVMQFLFLFYKIYWIIMGGGVKFPFSRSIPSPFLRFHSF